MTSLQNMVIQPKGSNNTTLTISYRPGYERKNAKDLS